MASEAETAPRNLIGPLLRSWRTLRGVSQLALSLEVEMSMRHLSYVETGRSQPSRVLVLRLADALQVPLRERNTLLTAAGFAPFYRETGLDAPELAEARRAIELMLAHHEPLPATVLDRGWNLVMTNGAARRFLACFPDCAPPGPPNALRTILHPDGLRPHIENWGEVAARLIQRLHRDVAAAPEDSALRQLLDEMLGYCAPHDWRLPDLESAPPPLLTITYRRGDTRLRFFSTIATFGTAQDITVQELRIEFHFPADDATRAALTTI